MTELATRTGVDGEVKLNKRDLIGRVLVAVKGLAHRQGSHLLNPIIEPVATVL
jgi:hypothetical protein